MAEAKIKNVLYDTLTDEVLLAFDKCVPSGEAWKDSLPPDSTFSGELSLIDAASCPSSLNKTTVEFNDYFRNKVVIFAGSPAPEEACTRDFFSFAGWTERLSRAGAAGVIHLSAAVGRTPGIWYTTYRSREALEHSTLGPLIRNNEVPLVPFVQCAVTDPSMSGLSSQADLDTFTSTFYKDPLGDRFAASTSLRFNVTVDENSWAEMYSLTSFFILFRILLPVIFLGLSMLAMRHARARILVGLGTLRGDKARGQARGFKRTVRVICTAPFMALCIEMISSLLLAIYLFEDGQWSNIDSSMVKLRRFMIGQLLVTSLSSSILVGLTFNDFRKSAKHLSPVNIPFMQRHRAKLLIIAALLIFFEVVLSIARDLSEDIWKIGNTIAIVLASFVTIWFGYHALRFSSVLSQISSSTNNTNGQPSENSILRQVLRHTRLWSALACVALTATLGLAAAMNFSPTFAWTTDTFAVCWGLAHVARAAGIFAKIQLSKLNNFKKSTETNISPTTQMTTWKGTAGEREKITTTIVHTAPEFEDHVSPEFKLTQKQSESWL